MATQKSKTAKWTIMVYIAADDTLANFAVGSLQQLRRVAIANNDVVVAVQFDADGRRTIPLIVFESTGSDDGSIQDHKQGEVPSGTPMADPYTLSSFINWACEQYKADHYCLVLWGHGPELLVDGDPVEGNGKRVKKFLTPEDLSKALDRTEFNKPDRKLDIIAIDACCMSIVELACELPEYAKFLIASQKDVPDFSFPYDQLLVFPKTTTGDEVEKLCREIPHRYVQAYEDYILTKETEIESVTLSSLSLRAIGSVTGPLRRLADALLRGVHNEKKRKAVMRARAQYKGFVAGLYTDLYDFCNELRRELLSNGPFDEEIDSACKEICAAIDLRNENAVVIANEASANEASQDGHCHGISIYFPYLPEPEKDTIESPPVTVGTNALERTIALESAGKDTSENRREKPRQVGAEVPRGGVHLLSKNDLWSMGGVDVRNKGGIHLLSKQALNSMRRQRIEETEQYYSHLKLSKETHWDKFIRHCWSRWLAEEVDARMESGSLPDVSDALDQQYSAQQCAVNLLSLCRKLEKERKADAYSQG